MIFSFLRLYEISVHKYLVISYTGSWNKDNDFVPFLFEKRILLHKMK